MRHLIRVSSLLLLPVLGATCRQTTARNEPVPRRSEALPALPAAPASVIAGDLLMSARSVLARMPTSHIGIRIFVSARNTAPSPLTVGQLCVVQIRVDAPGHAGTPAWQMPHRPAHCVADSRTLSPGQVTGVALADTLRVLSVQNILGDSLPEGRYAVEALVRTGDDTVTVHTGTLWLQPDTLPMLGDPSLLRFRTTTTVEGVAPRRLVTRTIMMNPTHRYMALGYGACSLLLRAYRRPERTGAPVWRSEYRGPARQSERRGARGRVLGYVCPLYLAGIIVAPGQVFSPGEFNTGIPVHEILGDSLPDGRYYFVAKLVWTAYGRGSETDTVRVEAGSAELSSTVDPMPEQRFAGGLRYRAFTVQDTAHPDTLDIGFTATNADTERIFLVGAGNTTCSGQLFGYLNPADRNRWYLSIQPDWEYHGCPISAIPPTWLAPGESRTFSARVPTRADSAAAGRYSLVLVLRLEQGLRGGGRLVLSAGDFTVNGN